MIITRAISIDSRYVDSYNNRAYAYIVRGDFNKAIADATKAVALDPGYANAYVNRGRAYVKLGKTAAAGKDFSQACSLGNNDGCQELKALPKIK